MFTNIPYASAPKDIIYSSKMSSDEKILYISMLDLYKLSFVNDWKDDNGIFIYYSIPSVQKSIGCSRPKAIKILNLLEKKGYIMKEHQDGKSTKIYLVRNEYTEFVLESMENYKKNKKHKKIAPKKVQKEKNTEVVTKSDNVGVEVVEEVTYTELELKAVPIVDYTQNQSIFDVFKAIIGREPDNSFKKCMAKRAVQMNLTAENMRITIELARKARNPEAYILAITKPNTEQQSTYQSTYKQTPEPATEEPMEQWEIEWLEEIRRCEEEEQKQKMLSLDTSQTEPQEVWNWSLD